MKTLNYLVLFYTLCLLSFSLSENVKKSIDDIREDHGDTSDEAKDESLEIPDSENNETIPCTRRANDLLHGIRTATPGMFPFMAAIMSHHDEFLCSGTVVSNGMILTTALCSMQPLYSVLLNTESVKDVKAPRVHVIKTEKFPTYDASDPMTDVSIVYTEKFNVSVATKVRMSNFTSSDKVGEVTAIGYGLNVNPGDPKDLQYITVTHDETILKSKRDILMQLYIDCIDSKERTCFRDKGGPAVWNNELVGIITTGEQECLKELTSQYKIYKPIGSVIPTFVFKTWLDERIKKNEKQANVMTLSIYPLRDSISRRAEVPHVKTKRSYGSQLKQSISALVVSVYLSTLF